MRTIYNKKTKVAKVTSVLFATAILLSACNMDEKLKDAYYEDEYFTNTTRLEKAVDGTYQSFSNQATYGQYWMVYDTDTDISHIKGSGIGHVARDLGHYNIYKTHSWLEESWANYYAGIDRANRIFSRQNEVVLDANVADTIHFKNLIAQTKSLRAMCYFDLVRLFGDLPKRVTPAIIDEDYIKPKADRSEIYDLIITDLEEAIPDLPWIAKAERISKGAAMGMLARVYLFRGGYSLDAQGVMKRPAEYKNYYAKAKIVLDDLIESKKHSLLPSYESVFRNMCELRYVPTENMLEIAFYSPTGQVGTSSTMGTYNGPEINQASFYGRANSFIKTHHFFQESFDIGDLRKDVSVATYSIDQNNIFKQIARNQSYNWSPGKWRRNWQTGVIKDNNNTDVNVVLLRYSDVLLMRAEVENELNDGPNALAVDAINQVRRRAFGVSSSTPNATIDFSTTDFNGKDGFFDYLFQERARELAFEGHRRMDLIRWNLLNKAITDTNNKFKTAISLGELKGYIFEAGNRFKTGINELYPIPDYDVRATNGVITQNYGY